MKTIYYFDENNEFAGAGYTQLDPLETELQGRDIYLMPPSATIVEPPSQQDGYALVWNGNEWELVTDNRGVEYWLPGDTYNDPAREMTELGELPIGSTLSRPEKTQADINAERIAELKSNIAATDAIVLEMTENALLNGGNLVMQTDADTDYSTILSNRAAWRAELKTLTSNL